jgi:putative redox protein
MYADRKEWPLEEIGVRLQHRRLSGDEALKSEGGTPVTHEVGQVIELVGPLDEAQRARLLEIAHRCPVHRALEAGIAMPMEIAERDGNAA